MTKEEVEAGYNELLKQIDPVQIRATSLAVQIRSFLHGWLETTGQTQNELARRAGISPEHLSRTLSSNSNLQLSTISRLEVAIGEEIVMISDQHAFSKSLVLMTATDEGDHEISENVSTSSVEGIKISGNTNARVLRLPNVAFSKRTPMIVGWS